LACVTEQTEKLILEHLRATRRDIAQVRDDIVMLKQRLTSV